MRLWLLRALTFDLIYRLWVRDAIVRPLLGMSHDKEAQCHSHAHGTS